MSESTPQQPDLDFNSPRLIRHRKTRKFKDEFARISIGTGGISVIVAITLIFFYLLYEVAPLFASAEAERIASYEVPAKEAGKTIYSGAEEQGEKAFRVTDLGSVIFYNTLDGSIHSQVDLPIEEGVVVTSVANADPASRTFVLGLSNGTALVLKHSYKITYPNDQRVIEPFIEFPFGEEAMMLDPAGDALKEIAIAMSDSALMVAAVSASDALVAQQFDQEEDFLSGEIRLVPNDIELPDLNVKAKNIIVEPRMRFVFISTEKGKIQVLDLRADREDIVNSTLQVGSVETGIANMTLLLGGASILVSDTNGATSQWFMVRDDDNDYSLQKIRTFEAVGGSVSAVDIEQRRKGFVVADTTGQIVFYNSTAHSTALRIDAEAEVSHVAIAPRANKLLVETNEGMIQWWNVENEHPEISFSALWSKVWYEGYQEPEYIWQSSAANNDFEPKYSLSPLAFGTLKAAFYAMLVATPLAICGALYTAYFMSPRLRRKVKPSIELMEALPTVILGFLAGLFFAPFMEENLPGVFSVLIITPIFILLFGYLWTNLPVAIRHKIPDGWDPVLLIPVIIAGGWISMAISPALETILFDGDMRQWLTNSAGIDFDQRNALVVGAAMGFAVIPTIFSITEDAVFSVPKHLTQGSLALGATQWQTMVRVILPTASPGIFSAVMIGMGRAVGETMIVLMATGNTPIMDINIFEGMRTLSANIAVEMPESEVGSTHYRILFLAAFVLFLFTFVVNTLAEFVRQRLRNKYSVI
ncbi:phosphate ABC transporter permease [Oleiphilus sp. HI0071]|jgi:phosphate transport system permease protein|uniref:ABC transporter permease subunit n=1 Tax=unclassified Oleiphilus TaxID=2631174 RepID=UPI0007C36BE2|nr:MULTISPECIES: ABC transporter permease subunit [unclassified Oleiphilus]KZY68020.1 phosphate ABC transporter permease [Oleiphilus sp. HI0065]KZY80449.1 phosphate ABC transporter permease [Oleiphilus sp. HI0071]KZY93078.1 phosphate ABC transporter permease [Oleiphilus sp. HI0073]KZZ51606.1 phosphate ABC transporter permease [Oleiphilus sp. HI0122]KZZ54778.1 phosphate ABC transporter permease [Oleiphilus sp. HI0118]KZZ76646.1 phosphate ABC transporter permease [Oleiphilus sp. HI0133]